MKAAIYARVSTEDQQREGTSLQSQTEACLTKAHDLGYDVPEDLTLTETYSGLTLSRPTLARLRAEVQETAVNAIIVYTPDRLSRVGEDILILAKEFKAHGVKLIFVKEQWDDTHNGKLVAFMFGWASELEASQIQERTMRGKREALKTGKLPQGTGKGLYGYNWNKETKRRVSQEFEAKVVKRIFKMLADGASPYTVAKELNDHAIPTKSGAKWHPLTIKRMVRNPAYIGVTYFGRTKRIPPAPGHKKRLQACPEEQWIKLPEVTPPIVSKKLWQKANKSLDRPKLRPGRPLHDYLLTGHIACGDCGSPLIGTCLSHRYRYYRCRGAYPTATRPQICHARYIKADAVENLVWEKVKGILQNPELILQEIQRRKEATDSTSLEQGITRRHRELDNNINAEHRLVGLLRHGVADTDYVLDQINQVKAERKEIDERLSQLTKLNDERRKLENAEVKLDQLCSRVKHNLKSCSTQDRRLALDALEMKVKATSTQLSIECSIPVKFSSTEQTWA